MRRIILVQFSVYVLLMLTLTRCNTSKDNQQPAVLSSDVVAEAVAATLCGTDGGVLFQMKVALNYMDRPLTPGAVIDSSFQTNKNDTIAHVQYNYEVSYQFGRTLDTPPKFNFSYQSTGSYDVDFVSFSGTQSGSFNLLDIDDPDLYCTLDGSGTAEGTYISNHYNLNFSLNLEYSSTRIVKRSDHNWSQGTITLLASGTGPNNEPYEYAGVLEFGLDNNSMTFMWDGVIYDFNETTGKIQKH